MPISLVRAIQSGVWYSCQAKPYSFSRSPLSFRIRFLSFTPVGINEVDSPESVSKFSLREGKLWILGIEAVSLEKHNIDAANIPQSLSLLDPDGCRYEHIGDQHLCGVSAFSARLGLRRFYNLGSPQLFPKLVASGAMAFLLPDQDPIDYNVEAEHGTLAEV